MVLWGIEAWKRITSSILSILWALSFSKWFSHVYIVSRDHTSSSLFYGAKFSEFRWGRCNNTFFYFCVLCPPLFLVLFERCFTLPKMAIHSVWKLRKNVSFCNISSFSVYAFEFSRQKSLLWRWILVRKFKLTEALFEFSRQKSTVESTLLARKFKYLKNKRRSCNKNEK